MTMTDFIDLDALTSATLQEILKSAAMRKAARVKAGIQGKGAADSDAPLSGYVLALLFEKPSTRTRISFNIAMRQLGGISLDLGGEALQLQRGETLDDTGKVLSRYVDAIAFRTDDHARTQALTHAAEVPVINGLSDRSHPCQVLADILTFEERKGSIKGRTLSWIGDGGNNMARSWIHAATRLGFRLQIASPERFAPQAEDIATAKAAGAEIEIYASAQEAARGSDCIMTDTWVSMSDSEASIEERRRLLSPYKIDDALMSLAPDALFMHCLPAHRGEEVADSVLDGAASVVLEEVENRVHAQKAILLHCLDKLA